MKYLLHILLSLSILFPSWVNTALLVNYRVNKQYYAQNLCENKDQPEMHCEGSCQFSKQLKAANATDEQKEIRYVSAELQLFLTPISTYFLSGPSAPSKACSLSVLITENFLELLTPPPQLS